MLMMTEEYISGFVELLASEVGSKESLEGSEQVLQLSLCTMAGLTTKKSWKLWQNWE